LSFWTHARDLVFSLSLGSYLSPRCLSSCAPPLKARIRDPLISKPTDVFLFSSAPPLDCFPLETLFLLGPVCFFPPFPFLYPFRRLEVVSVPANGLSPPVASPSYQGTRHTVTARDGFNVGCVAAPPFGLAVHPLVENPPRRSNLTFLLLLLFSPEYDLPECLGRRLMVPSRSSL